MCLTIVLEWHLLPGSNLKIRFNAPSPGFVFQQRECTTSRREFPWKNFYSARIKFSPRMLWRFCFPAGFSPGSWRRVFFLVGSRRVQISWRDSSRFLPVGGAVASWLARSTPERALRVRALAGDIVLCSWARHFTLTVLLSTQVYKWVPANLMLGGNPAMD